MNKVLITSPRPRRPFLTAKMIENVLLYEHSVYCRLFDAILNYLFKYFSPLLAYKCLATCLLFFNPASVSILAS